MPRRRKKKKAQVVEPAPVVAPIVEDDAPEAPIRPNRMIGEPTISICPDKGEMLVGWPEIALATQQDSES